MALSELDRTLFFFINRGIENGFLDVVMPFVTQYSKQLFLPFVLFLFFKEGRGLAPLVIVGLVVSGISDSCGYLLKEAIGRPRPCHVLENVHLLAYCGKSFSMPSNHAANSFAFASVFWLRRRDLITSLMLVLAAVIGFSRIYVGVHYPFDVVAGSIFGMAVGIFLLAVYSMIIRKMRKDEKMPAVPDRE